MAHFAKIDSNNLVIDIVALENSVMLDADNTESELKGKEFLNNLLGQANWVQTSRSGGFRKNYAGVGYTYDSTRDAFIAPKPFTSWVLDEDTCQWNPPTPYPDDGNPYVWDEATTQWLQQ